MQPPALSEPRAVPKAAQVAPGGSWPPPAVSRSQTDLVRVALASCTISLVAAGKRRSKLSRRSEGSFGQAPATDDPGVAVLDEQEASSSASRGAKNQEAGAAQGNLFARAGLEEADSEKIEVRARDTKLNLPRIRTKFKKARVRWSGDGRRVFTNDDGQELNPYAGLHTGSSALANGSPKVKPKELEVELAEEDVNPEEIIFGERSSFASLGITSAPLLAALKSLGYRYSTRVQAASIPSILAEDRRAVVLSSETGSGKTLAYLVPAFELILRLPPRDTGERYPTVLVLVPSLELGVQVSMVAKQLAQAIRTDHRISVHNSRRSWPEEVPDILVCTPRAAAQGLAPCSSEDEMARRQALKRIKDVELVVFDEADLLLDHGTQGKDIQIVLTALAASFPDKPRQVQPEAQVYRPDGIPVEVLGDSMDWTPGLAWHNPDGTYHVKFENGNEAKNVRRRQMRGPGIGLLVENGPRFVAACATLPSYSRGRCIFGERSEMQDNSFYNSGIGSVDWVMKRWYPNAVRIQSPWLHRRHPGIERESWVYIPDESRKNGGKVGAGKGNLQLRIQKTLEILEKQGPDVRTIVFANTPEACLAFEMACKSANIEVACVHAGVTFPERIEGLKKFGIGEVSVLICTDLGARGLDLPICQHVIQLEFAGNSICYLHRVGRATRAANKSQVTNLWGDPNIAIKDLIMKAPQMGLEGEVVSVRGNRCRHRRVRQRQRRNEFIFSQTRGTAQQARKRTQVAGTEWTARSDVVENAAKE